MAFRERFGNPVLRIAAFLSVATIVALVRPANVGVDFQPIDGLTEERALAERFASDVEASRHDGKRGRWIYEKCVTDVAVYSAADRDATIRLLEGEFGVPSVQLKLGADMVPVMNVEYLVLADDADLEPFERSVADSLAPRVAVLALTYDCPQHPSLRERLRALYSK